MNTRTILVSGASGIVGYGALKTLRQAIPNVRLVGTSIYEDSIASAFCDIFKKAPRTDSAEYLPWLQEIVHYYQVDMLIPGLEIDVQYWNEHRSLLIEWGTFPLLNTGELINICADKWLFYLELSEKAHWLAIPSTLSTDYDEIIRNFGHSFLLKPRHGFAGKGIISNPDRDTFYKTKEEYGDRIMAQPIIGSMEEEYTVSAFFTLDSILAAFHQLRRKLSSQGFTSSACSCDMPGMRHILMKLGDIFHPVGPTNFQFRKENGRLKLLEINPRISSSTSIRALLGYNEAGMSVQYFLDHQFPTQPLCESGKVVRYMEDYILPAL